MIRALLCDENRSNFVLLRAYLAQVRPDYVLDSAPRRADALTAIGKSEHQAYLVHADFDANGGIELVRRIAERGRPAPTIFLLSHADPRLESTALAAGASDVLVLDDLSPESLERTLRHGLERVRIGRATGFWGQEHVILDAESLTDRLDLAVVRARRTRKNFALMTLGWELPRAHRHAVNRAPGLFFGTLTERVRDCIGVAGWVARTGPRELTIWVDGMLDAQRTAELGGQILTAASTPISLHGVEVQLSARLGLSVYPDHGHTSALVLSASREAMNGARADDRSQLRMQSRPRSSPVTRRSRMLHAIEGALDRGEIALHYQPQIDLRTGKPVGAEALMRWSSEKLGDVSPGEFVPLLEETDLITTFGDWAVAEACRQSKRWMDDGIELRVGVNVSAQQFARGTVGDAVRRALSDSNLPPRLLEIEITEGLLLENTAPTLDLLRSLRHDGISVAVDDFGTGYASLSYVKRFPMDAIKIDREFVRNLPLDTENAAITNSIVALARNLGLEVVAEGVETEAEQEFLSSLDCHVVQGFLHARPMPADSLTRWMHSLRGHSNPPPAGRKIA